MELSIGNEVLKLHFGEAPEWLLLAESRRSILSEAMLRAFFQNDSTETGEFNARMSHAKPITLASSEHNWIVTLVLQTSTDWPSKSHQSPWRWFISDSLESTLREAQARIPSLDLASRVLKQSMPNVMTEMVLEDRVYLALNDSFNDAVAIPKFRGGQSTISATMDLEALESDLKAPELGVALKNAIAAPAVPLDARRSARFEAALENDRLADEGGSYGSYELRRELQLPLMRASQEHVLAVLFVDMNGLKRINDEHGHAAGDDAIAEFRLAVRDVHGGNLFRTGGDEFALFDLASPDKAAELGRRLLRSVATRTVNGDALSASVGIVLAVDPSENPDSIVNRADKEMYRAKQISRETDRRPCALAIQGADVEIVDPPHGVKF